MIIPDRFDRFFDNMPMAPFLMLSDPNILLKSRYIYSWAQKGAQWAGYILMYRQSALRAGPRALKGP